MFLFVLLCLFPFLASAQPSQRWLLIIDMSRSMKERSDGVNQAAAALVRSGMNGQMRRGDSFGLWTFNETVHTGRFPLQEWSPEHGAQIAARVAEFLRTQKFEKDSKPEVLYPAMLGVIQRSEFITVVWIGDAREKIQGTPFDDRINASFEQWKVEQQKRQMPVVTLLRAQRGKITDFAIGAPPWPMDFPPLPAELLRAEPVKPAASPAAPANTRPPLIISGKKPEPEPAATPAPEPPPPSPPAPSPAPVETIATAPDDKYRTGPEPGTTSAPPPANPLKPAAPASPLAPAHPPAATSSVPAASPSPPVETATSMPVETVSRQRLWIIVGSAVAAVLILVVFLMKRRSRDTGPISLITRSLDREQE